MLLQHYNTFTVKAILIYQFVVCILASGRLANVSDFIGYIEYSIMFVGGMSSTGRALTLKQILI